MDEFLINVVWDDEAKVWYVHDSNVPGLITEAETLELMRSKLLDLVPELVAANHLYVEPLRQSLPMHINFQTTDCVHLAAE